MFKFFFSFLFLSFFCLYSQINIGLKGGFNFDSMGDLDINSSSLESISSKSKTGFHFGGFIDYNILLLSISQELIYSENKTGFGEKSLSISKIEIPVLIGYKVFGKFLILYTGPSFQYILNQKSKDLNLDKINKNLTMSFKFGGKIMINRIGISLFYERGFTENEVKLKNSNSNGFIGHIHVRPNQFSLSLNYLLKFNKKNEDYLID